MVNSLYICSLFYSAFFFSPPSIMFLSLPPSHLQQQTNCNKNRIKKSLINSYIVTWNGRIVVELSGPLFLCRVLSFLTKRLLPSSAAFFTFCCFSLCLCHSRKRSSHLPLYVSCCSPLLFFFVLRQAILYSFLSQVQCESQIFKVNYWMHFFICITVTAAAVDMQWYSFVIFVAGVVVA